MRHTLNLTERKNRISERFTDQTSHVIDDKPDVLRSIIQPGVNLSLWQRPVQPEISQEISVLQASDLPDVRCDTAQSTFINDVNNLLNQQGLNPDLFPHWRRDLQRLANLYFGIIGERNVTMRLETTDVVHCPRFHIDRAHLRLLCTYQGPSTEWLTNAQTDREAQLNGATNDEIIRFGEPSQFGLFTVGIMKGSAYPGNSEAGLMHRSPSIGSADQTRVLLCLDS